MKKLILILAIILTSTVAALCLSLKSNVPAAVNQIKREKTNIAAVAPDAPKADISSAD